MQESADKAVAAVSVIITAARPVSVVGKKLEHEIEQLHRFCDLRFGHWFDRSPSEVTNSGYHGPPP
jgi:ribosomal protein S3